MSHSFTLDPLQEVLGNSCTSKAPAITKIGVSKFLFNVRKLRGIHLICLDLLLTYASKPIESNLELGDGITFTIND